MPAAEDGFGNHHVERQTIGMPPQRVRPDTADVLDLREDRADAAGGQDGLDLKATLRGSPDGQYTLGLAVVDPVSGRGSELDRRGTDVGRDAGGAAANAVGAEATISTLRDTRSSTT